MSAAQEAPALPGEVWRDADDDGLHIAIIKRDGVHMARWWSVDRRAWICADTEESAPIFAAWGRAKAAEVDRLTRERDEADRGLSQTIEQRDYYQEQIGRLAERVGCQEEWSNQHAHACCIDDAIDALEQRAEKAERERDEARSRIEAPGGYIDLLQKTAAAGVKAGRELAEARAALARVQAPRWQDHAPTCAEVMAHAAAHPVVPGIVARGLWLYRIDGNAETTALRSLRVLMPTKDRPEPVVVDVATWEQIADEPGARWLPCAADGTPASCS